MKYVENARVVSTEFLQKGICNLVLECPKIAKDAKPGQFIEIYPDNGVNLLSRPISICGIDVVVGNIRVVFQVVGKGTDIFSKLKKGDKVRVLGPCGNGYTLNDGTALLVGGGIGVPPLLETAKRLDCKSKIAVLGFRSNPFLVNEFARVCDRVYVTTDDGSEGFKGNVVQLMEKENLTADMIYSCGLKIMLKFLSEYAMKNNIPCQVSMEERMACGIGACVGCVVEIKEGDGTTYKKVCKDGPVFDCKEVVW